MSERPVDGIEETYFHHQERAAAALQQLVTSDALPVSDVAIEQALAARTAVLDNLRERLFDMGARTSLGEGERRTFARPDLELIQRRPVTMLDQVLAGLPRPGFDPAGNQARHVTFTPDSDPAAVLWRQAADELMLANHALSSAQSTAHQPGPGDRHGEGGAPWLTEPGAAWYLLGDTATATEALCVLDDRLREVGLLPAPTEGAAAPTADWSIDTRRLVTSQQARLADWYGTSDAADLATRVTPVPQVSGPVQLVRVPADLMPAQRRLAAFIRPVHEGDAFSDAFQRMDAQTFRVIARGQQALCSQIGVRLRRRDEALGGEFTTRAEVFTDLVDHSRRLVDLDNKGSNSRALWQQQEISSALRRFGYAPQLDSRQARDLADATHQVLNTLGRATLRETRRDASNLRLRAAGLPPEEPPKVRVGRRGPLSVSLIAAVKMPAPGASGVAWQRPVQRASLRASLDHTPTHGRPPHPLEPHRDRGRGR